MNPQPKNIVIRDVVNPNLCAALQKAGLNVYLKCFWKVYDKAYLKSYIFDSEDYYLENDMRIDTLMTPKAFFPAFMITDLDLILPDYTITRLPGEAYTMDLTGPKKLQASCKGLADVYGVMALTCIYSGVIDPSDAVQKINQYSNQHV